MIGKTINITAITNECSTITHKNHFFVQGHAGTLFELQVKAIRDITNLKTVTYASYYYLN